MRDFERPPSPYRSILERGYEIERDFHHLKAQEWACEPHEAKVRIKEALDPVREGMIKRRLPRPEGHLGLCLSTYVVMALATACIFYGLVLWFGRNPS